VSNSDQHNLALPRLLCASRENSQSIALSSTSLTPAPAACRGGQISQLTATLAGLLGVIKEHLLRMARVTQSTSALTFSVQSGSKQLTGGGKKKKEKGLLFKLAVNR